MMKEENKDSENSPGRLANGDNLDLLVDGKGTQIYTGGPDSGMKGGMAGYYN